MEARRVPPFLFAYLGRRNARFIRNAAGVIPLIGFLCVYPRSLAEHEFGNLSRVLNHPATLENLRLVAKSYGGEAIKVEPRALERLCIPEIAFRELNIPYPSALNAQLAFSLPSPLN